MSLYVVTSTRSRVTFMPESDATLCHDLEDVRTQLDYLEHRYPDWTHRAYEVGSEVDVTCSPS